MQLIISLNGIDIILDSWFKQSSLSFVRNEIVNTSINRLSIQLLRGSDPNYYRIYFFGYNSKLLHDLFMRLYKSTTFLGNLESAQNHIDRFLIKINKLKLFI